MVLRRVDAAAEAPTPDSQSSTTSPPPPVSVQPNERSSMTMENLSHRIPSEDMERSRDQSATNDPETSDQERPQSWLSMLCPRLTLTDEELEMLSIQGYEEDGNDTCSLKLCFSFLMFFIGMAMAICILVIAIQDGRTREQAAITSETSTITQEADTVTSEPIAYAPSQETLTVPSPSAPAPAPPAATPWPSKEEIDNIVEAIIKVMQAHHEISTPRQVPEDTLEHALNKIKEDRKVLDCVKAHPDRLHICFRPIQN